MLGAGLLFLMSVMVWSGDGAAQEKSCAQPDIAGVWHNVRAQLNTLSVIEITYTCDKDGPYGLWQIRALEKCKPRDCTWGRVAGIVEDDETISATFSTFSAKRTIATKINGSIMRVKVDIDYLSEGRSDTLQNFILTKKSR